ncbi:MAG: DUF1330 domain-containing protein [Armatimonadetes bacterium]|nr:DUF1330 domain-containing protein [Armatimonadota bacterium]
MSVLFVAEINDIEDPAAYAEYGRRAQPIISAHGGRYLVRGGSPRAILGDWAPMRLVVIEFESEARARACFTSPEYLAIAPLRERATRSHATLVDPYQGE